REGMKRYIFEGTAKNRLRCYACILSLMALPLMTIDVSAGSPKEDILQEKMTEISSVRGRILEKRAQIIEILHHLKEQRAEIEGEIKSEQERLKIGSYQKAIGFPRIDYNLRLVQRLHSYISVLGDKVAYLQIGNEILESLYEHADDDLRLVQTLNDMEVENLTSQIDLIIQEYLSETDDLVSIHTALPGKPESIWNEIVKGTQNVH
ncbi:MAG: hypothetical protein SV775_12900, partial [Thermodesulfobacteriota bacterium]|nr:hypothetical protein [Thermodesulfobacteriota bacterium]